jgi:hypothetical protein
MDSRRNDRIQARTEFAFGIMIFVLIVLFVIIIAIAIYFGRWNGVQDGSCIDYKPCTNDLLYPDHTCKNPVFQNGTFCSPGDVCFNTSSMSFCINGICQGPSRQWCRGFCLVDSDCPDLPFSARLSPVIIPEIDCIQQSCVYTITGGMTDECLSWIDFTPDNPVVAEGCLTFRFTDEGYTYPPGICLIRYQCAPFNFNPALTDTSDLKIDQNKTNEDLVYLKKNNLLFNDISGKGVIQIRKKFTEIIGRSKINRQNRIDSF